jgi:hypothetical protein
MVELTGIGDFASQCSAPSPARPLSLIALFLLFVGAASLRSFRL